MSTKKTTTGANGANEDNGDTDTKKATKKKPRFDLKGKGEAPVADPPSSGKKRVKEQSPSSKIVIHAVRKSWARFFLHFITGLMFNRITDQTLDDIAIKQITGNAPPKRLRNPEQEFLDATHICEGKYIMSWLKKNLYGCPGVALKKGIAAGMYRIGGAANMKVPLSVIFVHGPYDGLIPLYEKVGPNVKKLVPAIPTMRRDAVIGQQGAKKIIVPAYRPYFAPGKTAMMVDIRWPADMMSLESVANGVALAGEFCGLGSWRVENAGEKGMFTLDSVMQLPDDYQPQSINNSN